MINLTAGNITVEGEMAFYSYRGKGGKRGRRELPRPAFNALLVTLADATKTIATMAPEESLWQAGAGGRGVTSATFYNRLRKYMMAAGLPPTGVHILRHTAAKLRRDAGESIEAVSQFLDHSGAGSPRRSGYERRFEASRRWPPVRGACLRQRGPRTRSPALRPSSLNDQSGTTAFGSTDGSAGSCPTRRLLCRGTTAPPSGPS